MIKQISHLTVIVRDQDEALKFYTEKLGFEKCVDQQYGPEARWLTVVLKGQKSPEVILFDPNGWMAPAEVQKQIAMIGKAPTVVLVTDNCEGDFESLTAKGVKFTSTPKVQPWGTEAMFEDLYGNIFVLNQPRDGQ